MENKDWDSILNNLSGDLNPGTNNPSGEEASGQPLPDPAIPQEEELLRDMLHDYSPNAMVEGWEKIAASLDASDEVFDQQVRNRIHHYYAAYDPHSWSKFAKRFSAHKHLRTRLIVVKLSEAAAILLLVLTVLQLDQIGNLPFPKDKSETTTTIIASADLPSSIGKNIPVVTSALPAADIKHNAVQKSSGKPNHKAALSSANALSASKDITGHTDNAQSHSKTIFDHIPLPEEVFEIDFVSEDYATSVTSAQVGMHVWDINEQSNIQTDRTPVSAVAFLNQPVSAIEYSVPEPIHQPTLVGKAGKKYFEFGMLAQADYNQLKMPEDRLNSNGEQIIFPLQGITSPGFGAGFTLAIGHPRWAVETGVIYNAKTFRPGRELTIGNTADNSKVAYEAMHMQLISIPMQFRYRFDASGRFKVYTFGGFGLHLIAQSDIDVKVDYNFPSLAEGEDPNANPALARTIRQTQRVSNDIRDRAPFSTNSYISANLGLGIEYALPDSKTLFLQTAYQYQIPNLRFSNHNGKHVLSLSLQAGVRTPLGI
jgi:hypothetical protein